MDTKRLMLRAALDHVLSGTNVAANVAIALTNMSGLFEEADDLRRMRRRRASTSWTETAMEVFSLLTVGNFSVSISNRKRVRTIRFTDGPCALEFRFEHQPRDVRAQLGDMLTRLKHETREEQIDEANALVASALTRSGVGGAELSPEEILVGGTPLSLNDYALRLVVRVEPRGGFLSFLPEKKTVVYAHPSIPAIATV